MLLDPAPSAVHPVGLEQDSDGPQLRMLKTARAARHHA